MNNLLRVARASRLRCFLFVLVLVLDGCAVVSENRVFPKATWYWSADAKRQRADYKVEPKE